MQKKIKANTVSDGFAIGPIFHYHPYSPKVVERVISSDEIATAIETYERGRETAKAELDVLFDRLSLADTSQAKIFQAHVDILFDIAIDEDIRDEISYELLDVSTAVNKVFNKYIAVISKSGNPLISERTEDLEGVKRRLLRCIEGIPEPKLVIDGEPIILVAYDLLPSDTANLDKDKVLAIVTQVGGVTSHSAIIARSYEIPALNGVDIDNLIQSDTHIIVDAVDGYIITSPTNDEIEHYTKLHSAFLKKRYDTKKYLPITPQTSDGFLVNLDLNVGSLTDVELKNSKYVDGVGLFRTEFIYMTSQTLPDENQQFDIYKKLLQHFGDRPVTLRTTDIGGDKEPLCLDLPPEQNPFLGNRAIRLCFSMPELLRVQLRACLRASVYGKLRIMFPMVGSLDDIYRAKEILQEIKTELDTENIPYSDNVQVGAMIEIPSMVVMASELAQEVDFASIGTNDLTQYTIAVDRLNPLVSDYYHSYTPAIFRLISHAAKEFQSQNKPICICGELGSDPLAVPALIGLGVHKLSVNPSSVAPVKKVISQVAMADCEKIAQAVLKCKTANQVEAVLKTHIQPLL